MCEESCFVPEEEKNELRSALMLFNKLSLLSNNFFDKSPTQMAREASGLALSPSMLAICRSFFGNNPISEKELYILEAYANAIKSSPAHYSVSSLLVNEPYIAETYGDMMKKYAALYPEYDRPCNVEKMLSLGGEAVCAGLPRRFSSTDIRVSSGKNGAASKIKRYLAGLDDIEVLDGLTVCRRVDAFKFREKTESSMKAAIIYAPQNEDRLLDFCKSIKCFKPFKITAGAPYEIFLDALYSFNGIQIIADIIPAPARAMNLPPEYRAPISVSDAFFTDKTFGECVIFAVGRTKKIQKLVAEAEKQGLQTSLALQPQNIRLFSVTMPHCPVLKFKSDLLKMMYHAAGESATVPKHSPELLPKKSYGTAKVYESPRKTDAVYSVSLDLSDSPAPFNETLLAATELIVSAVMDGYLMKNGTSALSVSESLPLSSPEGFGHSLSAILGIYRAVTELGIPMEDVSVEASEEAPKVTLSLRAFSPKGVEAPTVKIPANSLIYGTLDENFLPNFEILSKYCRGEYFPVIE